MARFEPVIFRTTSGYKFTVTCLQDVIDVMSMSWPSKECEKYLEAACLTERAKQGWCKPAAAYNAFVEAARAQKRVVARRPMRKKVAEEYAAIIWRPS